MNHLKVNAASGLKKPFKILRFWCLCAGSLGLFQSLAWIALCIVGILSYKCAIPVNVNLTYGSLLQTVYMEVYFKGNCTPPSYPKYDLTLLQTVQTVLDVKQILIWNCVYLAVAICWCMTSTWMLIITKRDESETIIAAVSTWIAVMLSVIVMDFALAIIFSIDYNRFTQEADKFTPDDPKAALLFAGMIASMTMMILSFKGFILWLINVAVLTYLIYFLMKITNNTKGESNWFASLIRKPSSNSLVIRPPIQAYKEDEKNNGVCQAFTNDGYEPDNNDKLDVPAASATHVATTRIRLNEEPLARAARVSANVSMMERRFFNIEAYQQYPPRSRPESSIPEETRSRPESPATLPPPDYTPPPTTKSNHSVHRNQRFS
uniref:Uncharacterized protein n=1 Tax=Glossina austeni TaxID=7395 RepID=A0A1A9VYN1_GLOAU